MNPAKKIRVGLLGSAGYTGGELLRLLLRHPFAEIAFAHSHSQAGKKWYEVHTDLFGDTEAAFTDTLQTDIEALFLCVGHGEAKKIMQQYDFPDTLRIIDLSQDFRHQNTHHRGQSRRR